MSSFDQGHDHHTLGLESDTPLSTHNPATASDPTSLIPPLPAYAYTLPSAKRPKVSTPFDQNHSSVRTNGDSRSDSPDPHDFYRRHQEQYRASLEGAAGQGDIRVEQREGGMAAGQRSSPIATRGHAPKLAPLTSRINTRYNGSPSSDRSPLSAAKSSPVLSTTARNRQTSLKDLVNKFNQTPDEALPLPKKSTSRSPSTNSNPGASSHSVRAKIRNPSLSKDADEDHGRKSSSTSLQSAGTSRPQPRRGRTNEDSNASPRSRRFPKIQRAEPVRPTQLASQSTTNLGQHADYPLRKPLFGEVLAMSPTHPDTGFGIPKPRRRRGSEGSMHSPNPMFPLDRGRQMHECPPSSPSAWYLGATPTLEEIKTEKSIPDLPTNLHRRTRSEFSGAASKPPASNMFGTDVSPTRDPRSSSSSTNTSKRNSRSRIPISTARRQSTTSDSGNSTHSTRASSALGTVHVKSSTRPAAKIPKPIQKTRSPPWHSRSSTPQKSPRRGDFTSAMGRPATSPRLAAYISAPMPKKSPPLRSSRPRQPVSNASTSASRARVVERLSSHENGSSRSTRDHKPRKPPELAGVDFAARRQRIQQAVTQTVQEEERRDEQRRASMALSSTAGLHPSKGSHTAEEKDKPGAESGVHANEGNPTLEMPSHNEEEAQSAEEVPKSERELTINTGHLSERSVLDLSMEDSPTLGTFHRFPAALIRGQEGGESTPSDIEPDSAITAGTSDSVDTFFDDEPQDDSQEYPYHPSQPHEQQTLLNHIMNMRDTTPSPESVRRPPATEESISEHDDRESIQIMLGESPVVERESFLSQHDENQREPPLSEGRENRWSMSSWTSSNRSRDDREAPMERIDEHSPAEPAQPAHLSVSTAASQQTPQPWSPQSFASPRTARTTMDSDTYSTINRVLDHYHDTDYVSPELINDVQQHIIMQSPDLARQGGWDPKKVTALYLQEFAKGKYAQSGMVSEQGRFQIRPRTSSIRIPEITEKEVRDDHEEKMVDSVEREDEEPTPPGTNLAVDQGEFNAARASLTDPNDWDMSPSLGGLEMQAEATDSPAEDRPSLPPKDWRNPTRRDVAEMPDSHGEDSRQTEDSRPLLPPIEGLGLELNLTPPQRNDSPMKQPPPPLPFHSPPPPPGQPSPPTGMRSPPSPSIYSKHVPSSVYPPARVPTSNGVIPPLPNLPSNATSFPPKSITPPPQHRASVERPPDSTDGASKTSSPSPDQKRLTKRRHIIKELVDTEHSFGQDMKVVDDIYRATANIIVMTTEDVKTLFGNSDQIVAFSTNFLDALKSSSKSVYILPKSKRWRPNRVSNATSYSGNTDDQSSIYQSSISGISGVDLNDDEKDRNTSIGEAFGDHMIMMEKVYTEYLKNHDSANQKLQALQKNHKAEIWLKECRAYAHDLTSAWDLDSLLVKPVQRILKYPLLLDQLLEVTPENHPDFTNLDIAAREMKGVAKRIDESKRRADLMEQVTNTRKRKESDVRVGLSKAFGRRTEKLRQQVGLSDTVEDKAYSAVSEKFGSHFFQLQVVMRDAEMYTNDVVEFMNRFCSFAQAMEAHVEVGQTSHPELESKWRRFRMTMTEMSTHALTDHVAAVRKSVIEPITALLKLQENPQRLMQKRNKRLMDFARFKALKDRGEKPDRKTVEQGEQFQALNDTLKDELPKLFALTSRLIEACLNNFVQLQIRWQSVWRKILTQVIDDRIPTKAQDIVDAFGGNFAFIEAQVLSLGVCNGSMLNEVANQINFLSPTTTLNGDDPATRQTSQSSSLDLSKQRTGSISSEKSPVIPHPDFGGRSSGSFLPLGGEGQLAPGGNYVAGNRIRANSTLSGHSPRTPEVPGSYHSYSNNTTPITATPHRPSTATPRTYTEPSPSISRPSVDNPVFSEDSARVSGATYPSSSGSSQPRDAADSQRYSGFFSSAMPMSDSPPSQSPAPGQQSSKDFNVIFLAASVYEFNIDRARKEAGYPYLTYVAGEVFDVIGEKGELWLAKNQDDRTNLVGWIWNKHFVKLAS